MCIRDREAAVAAKAQEAEAKQAEAEAKQRAREEAAAERASRPRTSSSRSAPKSGVEKVLGSATFWNTVIRTGSQVVRTMWGTAKR